jgi:NAD(P)-dependent dehydrogenase (short-subunit alcohol dehydrogenase family)
VVGDRIAIPFGGVLNATKSAFAIMSDTLRMELRPWGIRVVIIERASINRPAVDKTLGDPDSMLGPMSSDAQQYYGDFFRDFVKRAAARERDGSGRGRRRCRVALTDSSPRRRHIVGKDARALVVAACRSVRTPRPAPPSNVRASHSFWSARR